MLTEDTNINSTTVDFLTLFDFILLQAVLVFSLNNLFIHLTLSIPVWRDINLNISDKSVFQDPQIKTCHIINEQIVQKWVLFFHKSSEFPSDM